jgi:Polyketide cyclase / dehydrase and lipid transport
VTNDQGTMGLNRSIYIDRPPADVFRFYAVEHVRNHPRWDPDMHLELVTEGPIGVGTVIRRTHTHYSEPTEGTMEVVEFERDRALGVVIHDGSIEISGRMSIEPQGEGTWAHRRLRDRWKHGSDRSSASRAHPPKHQDIDRDRNPGEPVS